MQNKDKKHNEDKIKTDNKKDNEIKTQPNISGKCRYLHARKADKTKKDESNE